MELAELKNIFRNDTNVEIKVLNTTLYKGTLAYSANMISKDIFTSAYRVCSCSVEDNVLKILLEPS